MAKPFNVDDITRLVAGVLAHEPTETGERREERGDDMDACGRGAGRARFAWAGIAGAQGTAWIQVTVDTRTATGEQGSTFRAFTTSDQAGTQRIPVDRLCVKGIGHQVEERCLDNTARSS